MIPAYIGLGSNLDNPVDQVKLAIAELEEISQTHLLEASHLYISKPVGPASQPDYINAVAKLETALRAEELLRCLQDIEDRHGRRRDGERWGPRTLDLDLLLYGEAVIQTEHLIVPHPQLPRRNFVLYPLAEIEPDLSVPQFGVLKELLAACSRAGLQRLTASARVAVDE